MPPFVVASRYDNIVCLAIVRPGCHRADLCSPFRPGLHRLGIFYMDLDVQNVNPPPPQTITFTRGMKLYEMRSIRGGQKKIKMFTATTNHLGNVLATISDRKLQHSGDGTSIDYYTADVRSAQHYYPFGMIMPGIPGRESAPAELQIKDSLVEENHFAAGTQGWAPYNGSSTVVNDNGRLKVSASIVWGTVRKDVTLTPSRYYRLRITIDMGNCSDLHIPIFDPATATYVNLAGVGVSLKNSGTYEGTFIAQVANTTVLLEMMPGVNPSPANTGYFWVEDFKIEETEPPYGLLLYYYWTGLKQDGDQDDYYSGGMRMPKRTSDSLLFLSTFDAGTDGWAIYNTGTISNDNGRLKFSGNQVWSTLKKNLQLETGKQYRVRFTIDMGNCIDLHVPIYKSDISSYEVISGIGISVTASGTYEGTFTATDNTMLFLFEMIPGVNPPPGSTGYYWLDDVSVEKIGQLDSAGVDYRFGFNGQEKSDEIVGKGNHTTALFGEYDTRTGRRWNPDPKPNPSLSFYSVFGNNPIWHSDILLDTPTVKEAAFIADHVYGAKDGKLLNNWKRVDLQIPGVTYHDDNSGYDAGLYQRTIDGKVEYVFATQGTDPLSWKDWKNNIQQSVGMPEQYKLNAANAEALQKYFGENTDLTFVGHSLGGGLAAEGSMITNHPAITFNAAGLSPITKAQISTSFSGFAKNMASPVFGKIDAYVVSGEILNRTLKPLTLGADGNVHKISVSWFSGYKYDPTGISKHTMGAVKNALENENINK